MQTGYRNGNTGEMDRPVSLGPPAAQTRQKKRGIAAFAIFVAVANEIRIRVGGKCSGINGAVIAVVLLLALTDGSKV